MRKQRAATIEERITKLETELPHIYRELKEIRKEVSNDLPHSIAAVKEDLTRDISEVKYAIEKISRKYTDMDAVSRFLSVCLKGIALIIGVLWTGKQLILSFFKGN